MAPSLEEKRRYLATALAAAEKADAFISHEVARGFTTKRKPDGSFVTDVDTGVERLVRREIQNAFPDHEVTGEELGSSKGHSDFRWFIDPIDGTLSFKLGLPFYGIILFLCFEDRPIVAVVSHPPLNRLYHAVLGEGAYCNGARLEIEDVPPSQVKEEMIATGDLYAFRLSNSLGKYHRLLKTHPLVRTIPDCLGHTLAAHGSVGAMVDYYLNYWDFAATELLVTEAGGKFAITGTKTLADGRLAYNMICGKPRVVNWLLREVFR